MVAQTADDNKLGVKHQLTSAGSARAVHKAAANVEKAVDGLLRRNDALIDSAAYFVAEVGDLDNLQQRACGSVADTLNTSFSPEVLDTLKGNADQLFQLKQEVVAEKQVAKDSSKKMMLWLSGSTGAAGEQQGGSAATAAGQLPASDAVKQRGFRPMQLPGSSIAAKQPAPSSNPAWQALKFWQVGTQNSKQVAGRAAGDTPGVADQQPRQSLSSLLFGKHKRHSSGGADAAARRLSIDPAASWRSSVDGSFNGRRSTRSSDAGAAMVAAAAAAAAGGQRGAVMSSLAAGEGPLSKSHSMLTTKPGAPQEQIMGKSLEIVAEDEREGRDSPAPAEPAAGRKVPSLGQMQGLAPIRVPRGAMSNRPGSPGGSFSFNSRPEDEQPHSPSFLRGSVGGRGTQQQHGAVAGPLVRSSMALRTSMVARVDPFEAPEPEPQPFVEQLRDQRDSDAAATTQSGIMASVRRSMSGAGSSSRRTPRQSVEGTAWARHQQTQRQQQLQASEGGADMQFLDLDATRAYTLGVQQVMLKLEQGMQSLHSQSEASSKPNSPRTSNTMEAAAGAAGGPAAAACTPADPGLADSEEQPQESSQQQQQLQEEPTHGLNQRQPQRHSEQEPDSDSEPAETGPLAAAAAAAARSMHGEPADAVVPPLRSGMSSPAASRHISQLGGPTAVSRQLPLMGQASMEILDKPQQQRGASRRTSLVGASTNIALADVYKQTSGNLAPLSSHLSGIGRRSSSNSKGLAGPQQGLPSRTAATAVSSSRSILGEAGPQPGALTSGGLGPLSMQYGSSMQQAKKSAQAAGLAVGGPVQEQRQMAPGWAGPAAAAAATPGPAEGVDAAGNNKYASSWGILDAGGLSRQSSMNGGQMSRTQSANPMTRQGSTSARGSPRISGTDDGAWQQQRPRGAAGRYAGASQTPQSPRSGAATPAREDSITAAGGMAAAGAGGRRRASAAAGGFSGRQMEQGPGSRGPAAAAAGRDGSAVGSDDYESAEEQLSSGASGLSGLSGPYGSTNGGAGVSSARGSSATGNGGLPNPPAFLSSRPTSAQAAVATQWSPSKHAAAFAQAPAYMREAVLRITPEASSTSVGIAPTPPGHSRPTSRVVSPREGTPGRVSTTGPRFSSSSIGGRVSQASTQEGGGYNIYAPLGPPISRTQSGRQSQQQQVVTAVDLARRQSQIRRASSTGQQGGEYGYMSSNGRTSSSNIGQYGQYPQASPQREASGGFGSSGVGGGYAGSSGVGGGYAGSSGPMSSSRPQQIATSQSQQQWGQGIATSQSQQQWGQGRTEGREGNMHSAGIYGTIRPQQWQRQQYRF